MPAEEARALLNDDRAWRSYFKFAFERNPWDRQVSFYHHRYRRETTKPPFPDFIHGDRHARLDNYEIYSIGGDVAVDFVGRFENLADDLAHALGRSGSGSRRSCRGRRPRRGGTPRPIKTIMTPTRATSSGGGMSGRSELLDYSF